VWWLVKLECKRGDRARSELELRRWFDLTGRSGTMEADQRWAEFHRCVGEHEEALARYRHMFETTLQTHGSESEQTTRAREFLASMLSSLGDYEDAAVHYAAALESALAIRGEEHYFALALGQRLGIVYRRAGRPAEAGSLLRELLQARIRIMGERAPPVGQLRYALSCLAASVGQRQEALDELRQAVDLGWADRTILEDTDLDILRGDPEFEALVTVVKKRLKIES